MVVNGQQVEVVTPQLTFDWPTVAAAGPLSPILLMGAQNAPRPNNYTIDWTVGGTAPNACTFRTEGSSDAVNWQGLDATSPATIDGTVSGIESIGNKPVRYLRINVVTYTEGDGTTQVNFHFTGART